MAVVDSTRRAYRVFDQNNLRKRSKARFRFYRGFTLIELLVVVAIVAVLASIMFPVFTSAQATGRRTKCLSNLKQLSAAWLAYADDNGGRACPAYYVTETGGMCSWDYTYDPSATPGYGPGPLTRYTRSGAINACPAFKGEDDGRPYTGYAYNTSYVGGDPNNGEPYPAVPCVLGEITRPSAAVTFADGGYYNRGRVAAQNYLRAPGDPLFSAGTVHFRHNGQACVAYADGHVATTRDKYLSDERRPECGALSEDDSAYDLK